MYTTGLHGAVYSDYTPVGEIRCLVINGEDVAHYMIKRNGSQVQAWPVVRTDNGTGNRWCDTGQMFYFADDAEAEQYMSDRHLGVTRIQRAGVVERYLAGERLEDARA